MTVQVHAEDLSPVSGRILVTGGGGNIGQHLIRRLVSSGVPVTSIDVLFYERDLQQIHRDIPQSKHLLRVVHGDIRNKSALHSALTSDVAGVVNLAAVSRVLWCLENEDDCEDVNVRAVDVILEAMKRNARHSWLVQASSREVYGSPDILPVHEGAPIIPANFYGASKARAEEVVERHVSERDKYRRSKPLHAIALRLANVFGGENDHRERLVPSIMTQAMAHRTIQIVGGEQSLDMVHVDDVVDAFMLAIKRLETRTHAGTSRSWPFQGRRRGVFEVFNVASGVSTSVHELLGKILGVTQSASPLQTIPGDDRFPDRYLGNTARSSHILNFTARISVDEGIHRLATSYLRQTADYLEQKIEDVCAAKEYTMSDFLQLDGCRGSIMTEVGGQTRYLFPTGGYFDWQDVIEPHIWTFETNGTSGEEPVFQFRSDAGYFEVLQEGQARGEGESRFKVRLDPASGHVALLGATSGLSIFEDEGRSQHSFRLMPICCAGKQGPWPFFDEDPLVSAIADLRTEFWHDFGASRPKTLCTRLNNALQTARLRLDRLSMFGHPVQLETDPLPEGRAGQWRLRELPACANLCDHPTICVDTGDCMCVQSGCPSTTRFPFTSTANLPILSYPPPVFDEDILLAPDILKAQVSRSSWLNVLRPHSARYLSRSPSFPQVNVTQLPDDIQADRDASPDTYDKLRNSIYGCFSADSALERGVKLVSSEYSHDGLVFLPYYQVIVLDNTRTFPPVESWLANARDNSLPADFDEANLVIPFVKDWGACNEYYYSLFDTRYHRGVTPAVRKGTAWTVMGDLNVNCYRPDQDIVIPPRTCHQDRLREHFGDIGQVQPIRQRTILATFKGSSRGQGYIIRERLSCNRPYRELTGTRLTGGAALSSFWNTLQEGDYPALLNGLEASSGDYLATLNDTIFCPLPAGITGWATRTVDVIYSGCIPVIIGDQTHHPFWDTLDWSKFSIQVREDELDRLEETLLSYSWFELQQLQTNIMLIRDAFLYPSEGAIERHLQGRGPLFFAMHGTALLKNTKFPT